MNVRYPSYPAYGQLLGDQPIWDDPLWRYIDEPETGLVAETPCFPWEPTVSIDPKSGTTDDDDTYVVTVGLGLVNNVVPTNWGEPIEIGKVSDETPEVYYLILKCSLTAQYVSGVVIDSVKDLPAGNQLTPVRANLLPQSIDIILGTAYNGDVCMLYNKNIILKSRIVYQENIPAAPPNSRSYTNYYTLDPVSATTDAY